MIPFFLDIETAQPQQEAVQAYELEALKPPRNYVREEAKTKWLAENSETALERAALNPVMGEIISMAWAFGAGDVRCLVRNLQEEEQNFLTRLTHHLWSEWNTIHQSNKPRDKTKQVPATYVGHNVVFDLAWLHFRTKLWGVHWPFAWPEKWQVWDKAIIDTMHMADPRPGQFVGLDRLAFIITGERKQELDEDEQPYHYWLRRDYETVKGYNIKDVKLTRKVYTRLM